MNFKLFMFVSLFLVTHSNREESIAWGQNGHRVTGKIAEQYITKRTKKKIDKILNGESLAFVSTFADEIKSDSKYRKYSPWHYVNMDLDETYAKAEKNPKGDLVTAIETCITVLKDKNSSIEDQNFHLKMLVHFIGDLHQPMHIGQKEDRGGNDVKVKWFGSNTNLHSVWDTKMIESFNMSYVELANNAKHLSKAQVKAIEQGTILDWVAEVHNITKTLYASVKNGDNLSYRYSYIHFDTVRDQLQKGGIRLARILNDIYN